MAFTSVALVLEGTVTAATVLGAVAEIGVAMTVVGAVTGDKELMKIGGTMSLVGGVGGAIAGAAGAAEGAAAIAAPGAEEVSSELANVAASDVADQAVAQTSNAAANAIPDAAVQTTNLAAVNPAETLTAGNPIAPEPESLIKSVTPEPVATATPVDTPAAQPVATPTVNAAPADATANAGVTGQVTNSGGALDASGVDTATSNAWTNGNGVGKDTLSAMKAEPSTSFLGKFLKFSQQNDKLITAGLQLGGSALSGLQKASQFDQQMALANQRQAWGNSVPSLAPRSLIQSAKV